jgi:uncharacterized protein (DUF1697 family)
METYISVLRGINVGGHRTILMNDLKALYESLGFSDIITYVQSGNVIFKTSGIHPDSALAETIEKAIDEKYLFKVPVIIRTVKEMQSILLSNPFLKEDGIDMEKLAVTFLEQEPSSKDINKITSYDFPPDRFRILGKEIYLHCPSGFGNTKLSNTFFESKLHLKATTRNWKTVLKLTEFSA